MKQTPKEKDRKLFEEINIFMIIQREQK